jgi:hypothetical protein
MQIVSETNPDLVPGWFVTATIVISSMILPIYIYSILLYLFMRSSTSRPFPYAVMGFLGIINVIATSLNGKGIFRSEYHENRGNLEIVPECVYPEFCNFVEIRSTLAKFIVGGAGIEDMVFGLFAPW